VHAQHTRVQHSATVPRHLAPVWCCHLSSRRCRCDTVNGRVRRRKGCVRMCESQSRITYHPYHQDVLRAELQARITRLILEGRECKRVHTHAHAHQHSHHAVAVPIQREAVGVLRKTTKSAHTAYSHHARIHAHCARTLCTHTVRTQHSVRNTVT
jgi:stress response protein YsnF